MKQLNSKYSGKHKSVYLLFIGDTHLGNKYFNKKYLDQALLFAERNRDRTRILLMGDIIEAATKTSVGRSVYDEEYPTYQQFEYAINVFKPYSNLIDLVIEGNHEERIIRDTSLEIVQEFCHRLDIYDAYGKFSSVLNISVGDLIYSVYAWHGSGGGVNESSAINSLLKMREKAVAHVYAMGHTHKLLYFTRNINVPNINSEKLVNLEQMFINTGSALEFGGYGEQKGYPFIPAGFCVVELFADQRKMVFHRVSDLI